MQARGLGSALKVPNSELKSGQKLLFYGPDFRVVLVIRSPSGGRRDRGCSEIGSRPAAALISPIEPALQRNSGSLWEPRLKSVTPALPVTLCVISYSFINPLSA